MAVIYKCDRCGRESLNEDNLTRIELEYDAPLHSRGSVIIKTNICPICMGDLKEWSNPLPKQHAKLESKF